MTDRIAHTAGAALGWLLVAGVVVGLAPAAVREAREAAAEAGETATQVVRSLRERVRPG